MPYLSSIVDSGLGGGFDVYHLKNKVYGKEKENPQ
jgi:hypothetical protein